MSKVVATAAARAAKLAGAAPDSWPLQALHRAFACVTGSPPKSFRFSSDLFLAKDWHVAAAVVLYLVTIFGLRAAMRTREKIVCKPLIFAHNMLLSVLSGALFAAMALELATLSQSLSLHDLLCNVKAYTPQLQYLYYLNFLVKYYELVDTVFIVLAKRPLIFLHWFHHFMTLVLTFVELNGNAAVQWVPIFLNLLVHVVMYLYYALSLYQKNIPWKKAVTVLQITQFVLDLFAVYYASYAMVADVIPGIPSVGGCYGTPFAAIFGCLLLTFYLVLFISFFSRTYAKGSSGRASRASAKAKSGTHAATPKSAAKPAAAKSAAKPAAAKAAAKPAAKAAAKPAAKATGSTVAGPAAAMVPRTPARRRPASRADESSTEDDTPLRRSRRVRAQQS